MKGKRGQLTIFVILGIVILLSVGSFLYLSLNNTKEQMDSEFRSYSGKINRGQIQSFVEGCIENVGKPAIKTMASRGGYINIPVEEYYLPQIPVTGLNSKMVQGVAPLTSGGLVDVPLAYFNGKLHMPSIEKMNEELSIYMNKELGRCLDDFKPFSYDLEFKPKSNLDVEVSIGDEKVSFKVNYHIIFENKGDDRAFEFNNFFKDIDIRLGRMHDLAMEIVNYQDENKFLEELTLEMLAISDLPYEGTEIECRPKRWHLSELESMFKPYVMHNIRNLKFENTKFDESEIVNDYYKNFYKLDFTENDYTDMRVDASFRDDWSLNLDVSPKSNGEYVTPMDTGVKKLFLCIKTYHHKYDFFFPIAFRVLDEYKEERTIFNFAIPVSIRKGEPFTQDLYVPFGSTEDYFDSQEYCNGDERVFPIEIRAVDSREYKYISNVTLTYTCGDIRCDEIGVIDYPKRGNVRLTGKNPVFKGKFPECGGGYLKLSAPNYADKVIQIDTLKNDPEAENTFSFAMESLRELNVDVRVVNNLDNPGLGRKLNKDEMAIIMAYKVGTDESQDAFFLRDFNGSETLKLGDVSNPKNVYDFEVLVYKTDEIDFDNLEKLNGAIVKASSVVSGVSFTYDELFSSDEIQFFALTSVPEPKTSQEFFDFFSNVDITKMINLRPDLR